MAVRRGLHLAETLLACAVTALVLWGLLWLAFRIPGYEGYRLDPTEPGARTAVPISAFPWAEWAAYLAAFVGVPLAWESWRGQRRRALTPTPSARRVIGLVLPRRWPRELVLTIVLSAAALAYVAGATAVAHARPAHALAVGNVVFYAINWGVYAAAEETLFRGFVQRRFAKALPLWPAILLTAAIWAFVGHWRVSSVENLYLRLPVGIGLGWLYARSGSLLPPVVAHWLINLGVTAGL